MKLIVKFVVTVLVPLLPVLSCSKEKVPQPQRPSISFGSLSEAQVQSRSTGDGVVSSTTESMKSAPFGVYGSYASTPGLKKNEGSNVFNSSAAISVAHNGTSWEYSPLAYWSFNDYYRFRAYHPYSGSAFTVLPSSDVDLISIDYKVVNGNEDLMVAFWAGRATESVISTRVPMYFKHCLSGLRINVGLTDDSSADQITELYLSGLIPNGTMLYTYDTDAGGVADYDTAVIKWIAETFDPSTLYYRWEGSKNIAQNVTSSNPEAATPVFDGTENMVFTIPQTCSGSKGDTFVSFKTREGGETIQTVKLPTTEWLPGHIYTYTLLMAPKSRIDVLISIKDWEGVEINEDIHII